VQRLLEPRSVEFRQVGGRTRPEHLAEHGGVLDQPLFLERETVETRGDDPLDRLGKRHVLCRPALGVEAGELLGIEWVAARALEQIALRVRREQGLLQDARDDLGRFLVCKRGECERRRVQLASAPPRAPVQELRPCRTDDAERDARRPVGEMIDEVEQSVVAPSRSSNTSTSERWSASPSK
jgi:hypothetical protein